MLKEKEGIAFYFNRNLKFEISVPSECISRESLEPIEVKLIANFSNNFSEQLQ
jgi:hypothetical protein